MGNYLNPGNELFQGHVKNNLYVDKSGLIACLNGFLFDDKKKYVCVSRPRRFGKSYAADMITAYYGRGCDSHSFFAGSEISKSRDYEAHINKYDLIYLDVSFFLSPYLHSVVFSAYFLKVAYDGLTYETAKKHGHFLQCIGNMWSHLT